MKVLLTANTAWNLAHFRLALIQGMRAEGHEVVAVAPPDDTVTKLEAAGCRFVPLAMDNKGLSPLRDASLMRQLRSIFRRERPDAIFSFTIKNNIYGAFAAKPLHIPFIPNVTGLGTAFLSGRLLERLAVSLYRLAFKRLNCVFFQNEDDRTLFLERGIVAPQAARVLPGSGLNLDRFAPAPLPGSECGSAVFLLIGRMLRDKGVEEFVAAARLLRAAYPQARFRLLGATGSENRTAISHRDLDRWTQEGTVEYLGTLADVRPAILAADCVVLPSYREGTPRTLLEGAAMGRPLIATDVPGCREPVEAGGNGFLCRMADVHSLAEAMRSFVELDANERAAMGERSREIACARYDERRIVKAYLSVLAGVAHR